MFSSQIMPLVVNDDLAHAAPMAEALLRGGIEMAEVALRNDSALGSIKGMREAGMSSVGAGTVISLDLAKFAVEAGAEFLVSPGLHEDVIQYALEQGIPTIPGVATAREF